MKNDAYQEITDRILAALESGVAPWVKPWSSCGADKNAISGREYSGINTILLAMSGFQSPRWLTYKQASDVGAQVRKGEHGTRIVFFKTFKVKDANNPDSAEKNIPVLRTFTVFNTSQIDNLPEKFQYKPEGNTQSAFIDNPIAEGLLAKANIEHGGSKACFIPSLDKILLPNKTDFKSIPDYYATALHELTHWTGHKSRLDREYGKRFGDQAYAFEELVAELGAAFNCAHCAIDGQLQHESYIANWIQVLRGDKKAIFTASSAARKAVEYLVGKDEIIEDESEVIAA